MLNLMFMSFENIFWKRIPTYRYFTLNYTNYYTKFLFLKNNLIVLIKANQLFKVDWAMMF